MCVIMIILVYNHDDRMIIALLIIRPNWSMYDLLKIVRNLFNLFMLVRKIVTDYTQQELYERCHFILRNTLWKLFHNFIPFSITRDHLLEFFQLPTRILHFFRFVLRRDSVFLRTITEDYRAVCNGNLIRVQVEISLQLRLHRFDADDRSLGKSEILIKRDCLSP